MHHLSKTRTFSYKMDDIDTKVAYIIANRRANNEILDKASKETAEFVIEAFERRLVSGELEKMVENPRRSVIIDIPEAFSYDRICIGSWLQGTGRENLSYIFRVNEPKIGSVECGIFLRKCPDLYRNSRG